MCVSLCAAVLALGCGGETAEPPLGLSVISTAQSSAVLTWNMTPGVEYWVFYAPTSRAPAAGQPADKWIGLIGGNTQIKASSPFIITGLPNNVSYSFTVNGRVSGGPGGAPAPAVSVTAQAAGSAWISGTPNPLGTTDLRSVIFGSAYVAVGAGGAMYSSADGISWAPLNFATSTNLNGVAHFTNYLVVGDGGLVLLSNDTVTWTPQTSNTTQNLNAIARSGTLNVAVGNNGTIITSTDGLTWTPATASGTTQHLYAVGILGTKWIAVGAAGTIVTSTDGLTWTAVASGVTADLYAVEYGATTTSEGISTGSGVSYVAGGAGGVIVTSADAVTWAAQTLPGGKTIRGLTIGLQFVAVGAEGKIFKSTDALTWTAATSASTKDLASVAYSLNGMVAVGAGGANLVSR